MLRIKEVAKEKGISITELAQMVGVKQVTLSRTINGNPTIETLRKIAEALDIDVRELITPTKEKTTTATPLYIKNEVGGLISVGTLDISHIQE